MTKILVDVDDHTLALAAVRLGTTSKKETIGRALELVSRGARAEETAAREWETWADAVASRITEVDWDAVWR